MPGGGSCTAGVRMGWGLRAKGDKLVPRMRGSIVMPGAFSDRKSLILVGLLFAASVAPVFSVEIPAMIDYVNHLARMHLIVDAAAGRPNPAYEIDWRLDPNLAVDIIVPALARFVSVETAARLFLL